MPNPKKAIFPISVDNPGFTTELILSALNSIEVDYQEIKFFIADELQLYNKAAGEFKTGHDLEVIILSFQQKNHYFEERMKWITRIRSVVNGKSNKAVWTFCNIAGVTDQQFYHIFRNIILAFNTIRQFREDVMEVAHDYCLRSHGAVTEMDQNLSQAYILEEIAVNIRIRVAEKIGDEYYAFDYPKPLVRLYQGAYGIDVFTLAGTVKDNREFTFYKFVKSSQPRWERI